MIFGGLMKRKSIMRRSDTCKKQVLMYFSRIDERYRKILVCYLVALFEDVFDYVDRCIVQVCREQ